MAGEMVAVRPKRGDSCELSPTVPETLEAMVRKSIDFDDFLDYLKAECRGQLVYQDGKYGWGKPLPYRQDDVEDRYIDWFQLHGYSNQPVPEPPRPVLERCLSLDPEERFIHKVDGYLAAFNALIAACRATPYVGKEHMHDYFKDTERRLKLETN
jgi:hypothetical protein